MKTGLIKSTVLSILSLNSLLPATAKANISNSPHQGTNNVAEANSSTDVNRIIQKRLVGFDPKHAIETLTFLKYSGIQKFNSDGSIHLRQEMIQDIMEVAAQDGLEVRILGLDNQTARIKFSAQDSNEFERDRIQEAVQLAKEFELKCDMDGKAMF